MHSLRVNPYLGVVFLAVYLLGSLYLIARVGEVSEGFAGAVASQVDSTTKRFIETH